MIGGIATGLELLPLGRLLREKVGVRAAQSGHVDRLVSIDHDLPLGSLLHHIEVVIDQPLTVVVLPVRDDVADVAGLDTRVVVLLHQVKGSIQVTLIVADRAGGLVVHQHLDPLLLGVAVDLLDVKVGVGGDEVKDVVLLVSKPVLPAYVPSLYQQPIHSVGGREVDEALHISGRGSVATVGLHLGVVGPVEVDAVEVIGVSPGALAGDHLPPDAHVLHRLDPGGVLDLAGVIEVVDQLARKDVPRIIADDDRTPGGVEGGLHMPLASLSVWREVGVEDHSLVVQLQIECREVDQRCLVDIDVEPIVSLELQWGLHSRLGEVLLRGVVDMCLVVPAADLAETALGDVVLLCVVVARDPEGGVIACHGKLGCLLLYRKVYQAILVGELVSQPHAVIEEAEAEVHRPPIIGLTQVDEHLIVVVADRAHLAPDRRPGLIEGGADGIALLLKGRDEVTVLVILEVEA